MNFIEQLSAIALLVDFLFGLACGVIGGASHGSRRGALLVPAADDILSAGARVIYGVWTRGYPQSLLPGSDHASDDPRRNDDSESQEVDR
jgi:hypothetical protein